MRADQTIGFHFYHIHHQQPTKLKTTAVFIKFYKLLYCPDPPHKGWFHPLQFHRGYQTQHSPPVQPQNKKVYAHSEVSIDLFKFQQISFVAAATKLFLICDESWRDFSRSRNSDLNHSLLIDAMVAELPHSRVTSSVPMRWSL